MHVLAIPSATMVKRLIGYLSGGDVAYAVHSGRMRPADELRFLGDLPHSARMVMAPAVTALSCKPVSMLLAIKLAVTPLEDLISSVCLVCKSPVA